MANCDSTRITEKRYYAIPPQTLTADGTADGLVTIPDTYCFKVGQKVILTQGATKCEVKIQRVISKTELIVIEASESIITKKKLDISSFLAGSTIELREQKRQVIDLHEIQRQVYEEEPTVALRSHLVDWLGRSYCEDNPLPVSLEDLDVTIEEANINVQLTHLDNDPKPGDVHDSVRIGNGVNLADVTSKKELRTSDTLHCGGVNRIITVDDTPIKLEKVAGSPKADRKTVMALPLEKGLYWGFESNITPDDAATGGAPLFKQQWLKIDAEILTDVYLVGPASGIKVWIGEA